MLTTLVDRIEPLPDDQSIVSMLDLGEYEGGPPRGTDRMGIRNVDGLVYRIVLTQGIGDTVRLVRGLQKLGFIEEDRWSPGEGCSCTFRRRESQSIKTIRRGVYRRF